MDLDGLVDHQPVQLRRAVRSRSGIRSSDVVGCSPILYEEDGKPAERAVLH
jgi:hypothetical protein